MTVRECANQWESMTDEERTNVGIKLINMMSSVSHSTINDFQYHNWDPAKDFQEFLKAQAKVIRECVTLECSSIGKVIRESLDMKPLSEDMIVA